MDTLKFEVSDVMANLSEMNESFNNSVKDIMNIVGNKGDIAAAVSKLCSLIQSSHEIMNNLYELSQQNLLQLLAVQKDLELSNERRDNLISSNSSRLLSIETKVACTSDLSKVWITFSSDKELNELKESKDLISGAKHILKQMSINVGELGIIPIRAAYIHHIKERNSVVPALCIVFINDRIAAAVRRKIKRINVQLNNSENRNEKRFNGKVFWSKEVWKLLKICREMRRLKLINSVYVNNDGIRVKYNTLLNNDKFKMKTVSMNVTCFEDIDMIRTAVGDLYSEVSCTILYDNSYFKLKFSERDLRRSNQHVLDSDDDFDDNIMI